MTNRDYLRSDTAAARRHLEGVPDHVVEAVRAGLNDRCVDCGDLPAAGGVRCLPCFLTVSRPPKRRRLGGHEPTIQYHDVRRVA